MISILHVHYVNEYTSAVNPGLALVPVAVCQQCQLCWSLISATIPNLKAFVKSFNSGFGGITAEAFSNAYGTTPSRKSHKVSAGYEMGSVNKQSAVSSRNQHTANDEETQPLPEHAEDAAVPVPQRDGRVSIDSTGSRDRTIRKEVQWKISYESDNDQASRPSAMC